jgi:hypothetical protein
MASAVPWNSQTGRTIRRLLLILRALSLRELVLRGLR